MSVVDAMRYGSWLSILILSSVALAQQGGAEKPFSSSEWPMYRGVVVGKASEKDVIRHLGKPSRIDSYVQERESAYVYLRASGAEEHIVWIDWKTRTVREINVFPENLDLKKAIHFYGDGFRKVRYDFDDCLDVGGEAPLFESPNGGVEFLEYRKRGIFLFIEGTRVQEVRYARKPPGASKSQCVPPTAR